MGCGADFGVMAIGGVGVAMNVPPIIVRDLTATYQRHPAVHHVSVDFAPGSLTAIVGPNGAG